MGWLWKIMQDMITPEQIDFLRNSSEDYRENFMRVYSAWIDLGIEGCGTCEVPVHINPLIAPVEPNGAYTRISSVTHYAIELNGLKRPYEQEDHPTLHRQDRFNEVTFFTVMMRMGLPEEEFDVVCGAFKKCIDCDSALKTVGRNRTFEETKTILEAEQITD